VELLLTVMETEDIVAHVVVARGVDIRTNEAGSLTMGDVISWSVSFSTARSFVISKNITHPSHMPDSRTASGSSLRYSWHDR